MNWIRLWRLGGLQWGLWLLVAAFGVYAMREIGFLRGAPSWNLSLILAFAGVLFVLAVYYFPGGVVGKLRGAAADKADA